ncbi:hypothetical protein LARV_03887 [Longilinea arvoryzae]|uniref:SGNH/GDSL hydrolase family protein n=1 Tax=Longilinea arvoryzae TaxID=360412 RepID=A0A0K8MYH5_9CHLR|nr:hypothetical protein [Longilinea arvoryzae]GAP16091.1 hypothetical protein LARV_03887 [Longilinea arvoryzae]
MDRPTRTLFNALWKGVLLFVILDLLVALIPPGAFSRLSLYNSVFPGRQRLPFGENIQRSDNLSLYDLDAMFASLALPAAKPAGEYRVLVVGDSSVWGTLLRPGETLAGQLNALDLPSRDGRRVVAYNLGYPTMSLTKDLLLLERAAQYQPDLILWPVTLQSLPRSAQLSSPIVANNAAGVRSLIQRYGLDLDAAALSEPTFWGRTLIGQRRALADFFRLQLLGLPWAATGIDQDYPADYTPAARDLEADVTFAGLSGPDLPADALAWDALRAGMQMAGDTPVLLVNEPILISNGKNSDLRYNFFYPRWAYDAYRAQLAGLAAANNWRYLDLWDAVPETHFTNSAVHLDPSGEAALARKIGAEIGNR